MQASTICDLPICDNPSRLDRVEVLDTDTLGCLHKPRGPLPGKTIPLTGHRNGCQHNHTHSHRGGRSKRRGDCRNSLGFVHVSGVHVPHPQSDDQSGHATACHSLTYTLLSVLTRVTDDEVSASRIRINIGIGGLALRREDLGTPFKKYLKDLVARI